MQSNDSIKWTPKIRVIKYAPDTVARLTAQFGCEPNGAQLRALEANGLVPDEVTPWFEGNLLTTAGLTRITSLITGAGGAAFTNTLGFLGVGASSTAATVGDTALGGNGSSSTAWYRPLDATYPQTSAGTININCTFAGPDGNFAWNEWGIGILGSGSVTAANAIASVGTSPILVNHKIQSLGSKASGAIWTAQAAISLS